MSAEVPGFTSPECMNTRRPVIKCELRGSVERAARDLKAARLRAGRACSTPEVNARVQRAYIPTLIAKPKPELGLWEERAK